ncbi:MAG TPA: metallophosphoesterase [Candidatus Saccharimonadales bacterium]|nr:metallophosphoesterase [Candidatus Saccharimonadales bacterium]
MTRGRRLALGAGLLAATAAVMAATDATLIEPYRLVTSRVELPAGALSEALEGVTVVHLSDLHFKSMGIRERKLLAALRSIDPGLILMTGDYADTPEGIEALRQFFGQVHPSLGVWAVPGNNDYFRGRQDEIFGALRETGVHLLVNEVATIRAPGGDVAVAGVDDPFFGRDDLASVLREIPAGAPAILLAHSPSVLLERSDAILFNAGDADGPWGKGSFWTDGSSFRRPVPSFRLTGPGPRWLRVQVREDGVGLEAIRLVPALSDGPFAPVPRGLQGVGRSVPSGRAGIIDVDLCAATLEGRGGGWEIERGEGGCTLDYPSDRGVLQSYALPDPPSSVRVPFEAPAGVAYRIWARLHSPDTSGLSDSLYIQVDGAVDGEGRPRFRPGSELAEAGGPPLDLILAGHTHGGQVRLPWYGPVEWELIPGNYVAGRYETRGSMVYVSRGIGTSILPVRFDCPPEIVVFESGPGARKS